MKLLIATLLVSAGLAAEPQWRPLFNGKDLSGWVPVQVAPNTFTVRDGIIVSTGVPTGVMRTDRQYENFELELEWKHIVPQGNAGVFVWSYPITAVGQPFTRAIEVQVLDGRNSESYTSHGDVFSIHGARMKPDRPHPRGSERCLPSEFRCKPAGEWNHYRVVCNNGVVKLSVNGKEVSGGSQCTPRKGYICLEAEGTECHFRNIRIKELPSTNAKQEETAPEADNTVSIYNGLNLDGWQATPQNKEHWKAKDWTLDYDGKGEGDGAHLWTEKNYKDFVMICDWRLVDKEQNGDVGISLRGGLKSLKLSSDKPAGQWNRAVITARGEHGITVEVNEKKVENFLAQAVLSTHEIGRRGGPLEGQIALQQRSYPIQFANIYIKELPQQ
jgi:hypothetical protein